MKKRRFLKWIGLGMIACSLVLILIGVLFSKNAREENREHAAQLKSLLQPRVPGVTDQFTAMDMPVLQLDGRDYVALLEVPAFSVALPVRSTWGTLASQACPSRFSGTVYDSTLVIGGSDRQGHLDFLSAIENGDLVLVTDMTGAQFTYRVSRITHSRTASAQMLLQDNADLTLFAWDSTSLEYVIVRCVSAAS
jgi:hypothetical protein